MGHLNECHHYEVGEKISQKKYGKWKIPLLRFSHVTLSSQF